MADPHAGEQPRIGGTRDALRVLGMLLGVAVVLSPVLLVSLAVDAADAIRRRLA